MPSFEPRMIKDQSVEFPYRYVLKNIDTGLTIATYDIVPDPGEVYQTATDISAAYLQPIENFLKAVGDDLTALGLEIVTVDTRLSSSESTLSAKIATTENTLNTRIITVETAQNTKITSANTRLDNIDTALASKAPLVNPALTNPTANTVAVSTNSANLATTAAVKTYLDSLMAAFVG